MPIAGARIVEHRAVIFRCAQRLEFDIAKSTSKNISNGFFVATIYRAGKLPNAGIAAETVAGTQQAQAVTQRTCRVALSGRNRRAD